jgi:uncharacterized protein (DUF2267 family)
MASDPLLSAIQAVMKKLPKELQKGEIASAAPKMEKTIKDMADTYEKDIDNLLKAIAKDKKTAGKNKDALKEIEALEKVANNDQKDRMKLVDKSGSPV